jgi:catechol 2,3-dioxygenase
MLPEATRMGTVYLTVSNLEESLDYYQRSLGLQVHWMEGNSAALGAGEADLLNLKGDPDAVPLQRGRTGLFHYAILVPNRKELAHVIVNFSRTQTELQGASDHDVSEALYLADPDGNGIEIYADRPREMWTYDSDNILNMGTYHLDIQGILTELHGEDLTWAGMAKGTTMGHVHLHGRDIVEAEQFYSDILGFDLMVRYGNQASFMSAGGYHHHLGLNIWAGRGAPPPPENSIGLRWYEIIVPEQSDVDAAVDRLKQHEVELETRDDGVFFRDPSQNGVLLRPEYASA